MASGGDDRRDVPQNLQGLLKFCTELTEEEDRTEDRTLEHMTDEGDQPSSDKVLASEGKMNGKTSTGETIKSPEGGSAKTSPGGSTKASPGGSTKASPGGSTKASPGGSSSETFWSGMEQARVDQDRELGNLGLYRYKIPGDGNCMFRAIAAQLHLSQSYHQTLRRRAVSWMMNNADHLLAHGLLDSLDEIQQVGSDGVWAGQASLVAMANLLRVNIAVIQGGDKGNIDIQHFSPFESEAEEARSKEKTREGIILAYLYNGHYDAIVQDPDVPNPDYKLWLMELKDRVQRGEDLARNIARYGSAYGQERHDRRYGRDPASSHGSSLDQTSTESHITSPDRYTSPHRDSAHSSSERKPPDFSLQYGTTDRRERDSSAVWQRGDDNSRSPLTRTNATRRSPDPDRDVKYRPLIEFSDDEDEITTCRGLADMRVSPGPADSCRTTGATNIPVYHHRTDAYTSPSRTYTGSEAYVASSGDRLTSPGGTFTVRRYDNPYSPDYRTGTLSPSIGPLSSGNRPYSPSSTPHTGYQSGSRVIPIEMTGSSYMSEYRSSYPSTSDHWNMTTPRKSLHNTSYYDNQIYESSTMPRITQTYSPGRDIPISRTSLTSPQMYTNLYHKPVYSSREPSYSSRGPSASAVTSTYLRDISQLRPLSRHSSAQKHQLLGLKHV